METISPRCAGLDIHQATVVACARRLDPERLTRQLVKRLEKLGHQVMLDPQQDAA